MHQSSSRDLPPPNGNTTAGSSPALSQKRRQWSLNPETPSFKPSTPNESSASPMKTQSPSLSNHTPSSSPGMANIHVNNNNNNHHHHHPISHHQPDYQYHHQQPHQHHQHQLQQPQQHHISNSPYFNQNNILPVVPLYAYQPPVAYTNQPPFMPIAYPQMMSYDYPPGQMMGMQYDMSYSQYPQQMMPQYQQYNNNSNHNNNNTNYNHNGNNRSPYQHQNDTLHNNNNNNYNYSHQNHKNNFNNSSAYNSPMQPTPAQLVPSPIVSPPSTLVPSTKPDSENIQSSSLDSPQSPIVSLSSTSEKTENTEKPMVKDGEPEPIVKPSPPSSPFTGNLTFSPAVDSKAFEPSITPSNIENSTFKSSVFLSEEGLVIFDDASPNLLSSGDKSDSPSTASLANSNSNAKAVALKVPWFSCDPCQFPKNAQLRRHRKKFTSFTKAFSSAPSVKPISTLAINPDTVSVTSPLLKEDAPEVEVFEFADIDQPFDEAIDEVTAEEMVPVASATSETVVTLPTSTKQSWAQMAFVAGPKVFKKPTPSIATSTTPSTMNNTATGSSTPVNPDVDDKDICKSITEFMETSSSLANKIGDVKMEPLGQLVVNFQKPDALHQLMTTIPDIIPRGLMNNGNVCFMNSILQVLVNCTPFYNLMELIHKNTVKRFSETHSTPLLDTLVELFQEFKLSVNQKHLNNASVPTANGNVNTSKKVFGESYMAEQFYSIIYNHKRFSHLQRGIQEDAEEFLGYLLEVLHEEFVESIKQDGGLSKLSVIPNTTEEYVQDTEDGYDSLTTTSSSLSNNEWVEVGPAKQKVTINRSTKAEWSPITQLFGGQLRSVLKVPGQKPSITVDPFQHVQLDISEDSVNTIEDAFKHLSERESIPSYKTNSGEEVEAHKQTLLDELPPVLIIHLKRFTYTNDGRIKKLTKEIGYNIDLEIPAECMTASKRTGTRSRKYKLFGAVYHHGISATTGHYTVDLKWQTKNIWVNVDDTTIRPVAEKNVVHVNGTTGKDNENWDRYRTAYILLYIKV